MHKIKNNGALDLGACTCIKFLAAIHASSKEKKKKNAVHVRSSKGMFGCAFKRLKNMFNIQNVCLKKKKNPVY
jgi:hypothetical protein